MNSFHGTGLLLRLGLRRDRRRLIIWILALSLMLWYAVFAFGRLYPTAQDRQGRAMLMSSPAAVMMSGPGYGVDHYTIGAMVANEVSLTWAVAAAIMMIFLVVRHTRAEEESGRSELVRANPTGRYAQLTAGLLVALIAAGMLWLLEFAGLIVSGLAVGDSLALTAGMTMVGVLFAAIAAVTAQLLSSARGASGVAIATLAVAFVIRALGDAVHRGGSLLSWFSPIAWMHQLRAFVDLRWWPLLLGLALIAMAVAVAYVLAPRRDVGAAFVAPRPGPEAASRWLAGPIGLAWRQQRASLLSWAVALGLMCAASGSLTDSIKDAMSDNAQALQLFDISPDDLVRGFLSSIVTMIAISIGAYLVAAISRLHGEEDEGRAEQGLAGAISRWRWLAGTLTVAGLGTVALLLVSGAALGLSVANSLGDWSMVGTIIAAMFDYLASIATLGAVTAALYGLAPRLTPLSWLLIVWAIIAGIFGAALHLPGWSDYLNPFAVVASMPVESFALTPVLILVGVVAILVVGAAGAFRRRDIASV